MRTSYTYDFRWIFCQIFRRMFSEFLRNLFASHCMKSVVGQILAANPTTSTRCNTNTVTNREKKNSPRKSQEISFIFYVFILVALRIQFRVSPDIAHNLFRKNILWN